MIFSTTDCFGRKVCLRKSTWHNHILKGHPEMATNEEPIRETIEDPDFVYKSGKVIDTDIFYRRHPKSTFPKLYIKVAIKYDDTNYGIVRSCWFQPDVTGVEQGGLKYVRPKI